MGSKLSKKRLITKNYGEDPQIATCKFLVDYGYKLEYSTECSKEIKTMEHFDFLRFLIDKGYNIRYCMETLRGYS